MAKSTINVDHVARVEGHGDIRVVIADGAIREQGPKEKILPGLLGTASAVDVCRSFEGGN